MKAPFKCVRKRTNDGRITVYLDVDNYTARMCVFDLGARKKQYNDARQTKLMLLFYLIQF